MKYGLKYCLSTFALVLALAACKKDENRVTLESATSPVLTVTPLMGSATVLNQADSLKPFMRLRWTNPEYKFTTGANSQNVNYVLQIDTTGSNFTSPTKNEVSLPQILDTTFNVRSFNTLLSNVMENMPHNMEFRIKASLGTNSAPLYSNVFKMTLTPYLDVVVPVPTNSNLWIIGNAVASGWNNPLPTPFDGTQKFTKISTTVYELQVSMVGGGNYKLLQDNGNWGTQYHMLTGGTWESGDFEKRDADPGFNGPPSAGTYKITVNFKTGKYTVVKL